MDRVPRAMRVRRTTLSVVVAALAAGLVAAGPAAAAPGDLGTEDFSYAPVTGSPTADQAREQAVVRRRGLVGGPVLAGGRRAPDPSPGPGDGPLGRHRARRWTPRRNANADVLWHAASRKLYVASHVFTRGRRLHGRRPSRRACTATATTRRRARYTLDQGFPVVINGAKTAVAGHRHGLDRPAVGHLAAGRQHLGRTTRTGTTRAGARPYIAWTSLVGPQGDDVAGARRVRRGQDRASCYSYEFFPSGWYYLAGPPRRRRRRAGRLGHASRCPGSSTPTTTSTSRPTAPAGCSRRSSATRPTRRSRASSSCAATPTAGGPSATFGNVGDGHTRPIVRARGPGEPRRRVRDLPAAAGARRRRAAATSARRRRPPTRWASSRATGRRSSRTRRAPSSTTSPRRSSRSTRRRASCCWPTTRRPGSTPTGTAGSSSRRPRRRRSRRRSPPTRDAQDELTAPLHRHVEPARRPAGCGTSATARRRRRATGPTATPSPATYTVTPDGGQRHEHEHTGRHPDASPCRWPRAGPLRVSSPAPCPRPACEPRRPYRPSAVAAQHATCAAVACGSRARSNRRLTGVRIVLQRRTTKRRWTTVGDAHGCWP